MGYQGATYIINCDFPGNCDSKLETSYEPTEITLHYYRWSKVDLGKFSGDLYFCNRHTRWLEPFGVNTGYNDNIRDRLNP